MSDGYIGVSAPNRISAAFQKEDFLGSALGSITVGSTTYTHAKELDTDVDGANTENLHVVLDNVVQEPDVAYNLSGGGTSIIFALDDANAAPVAQATAEAGIAYRVSLDTNDENEAVPGTNDCSPQHLFDENIKASLYVHVVGGGSTFDILKVNDASRGAVVV